MPQNYGRSMSRNLDNVIGRVRVRLRKVGDDNFVDAFRNCRSALGRTAPFGSLRSLRAGSGGSPCMICAGFDQLTEDCPPRLHVMFQPQHRSGNFSCLRPRDPHNADSSAPGRRGNCHNRVVKIHEAIVAVTLDA